MALIKCRKCGKEISDKAPDCIHCGELIIKENASVDSALLISENKRLEQEITFLNNIAQIEKEKQHLETENAEYKITVAEVEKALACEKGEKDRLTAENDALHQQNCELVKQISASKKAISDLEQKQNQLESQKDTLEGQLQNTQKSVKTLERKIEYTKNAKKVQKTAKKQYVKVCHFFRLALMCFFVVGALVSLVSGKFGLSLWYSAVAIAVAPYLYRIIWKKVNLSRPIQIGIEIIVPIVIAFL